MTRAHTAKADNEGDEMSKSMRHDLSVQMVKVSDLVPWSRNPRHNDPAADRLAYTIQEHGWTTPILVQKESGRIIGGHTRLKAAIKIGLDEVPVIRLDVEDRQADAIAIADNRLGEIAEWDGAELAKLLEEIEAEGGDLLAIGYNDADWSELLESLEDDEDVIGATEPPPPLAEQFGAPPFTVLDARQGYWQDRKRQWLGVGIAGEVGRDAAVYSNEWAKSKGLAGCGTTMEADYTSVFDPVLCELAYRWFCPEDGQIVDPFAGGSVRGVVAGSLGRSYWGCDLRREQIDANEKQADDIATKVRPVWVCGDSAETLNDSPDADFVFSCPPYGDLEVYSTDPSDLSTMKWEDFAGTYREIIAKSVDALKPDRFACFVVGDFRDKSGNYRNFVSETISAFVDAGCSLYNEAILATASTGAAMRARRQFEAGRKLVKTHQNVLVFVKGDAKRATDALGDVASAIVLDD